MDDPFNINFSFNVIKTQITLKIVLKSTKNKNNRKFYKKKQSYKFCEYRLKGQKGANITGVKLVAEGLNYQLMLRN